MRLLDAERARVHAAPVEDVTFGAAAREWLRYSEYENEVAFATLRDYERVALRLIGLLREDTTVPAISSQDIEAMKTAIKDTGVGSRTVNRYLVCVGGIFRRANAKWGTGHNPAAGNRVKRLREGYNARIQFYTPEEVHALVGATPDPTFEALFMMAAFTGLRLGELRALRWRDVDLMSQFVHVERSYCNRSHLEKLPKSGKVRSVPLAPELQRVLARLRDVTGYDGDEDLVFPSWDGTHIAYPELCVIFMRAQQAADLRQLKFHELRHTFGKRCVAGGMDIRKVQEWMGHANIATTEIYSHFAPAGNEAALIGKAFAVTGRNDVAGLESAR